MISLSEARAIIAEKIAPLPAGSQPLAAAAARILRENIHARQDLPAFDRSAMDGYAVAADDPSAKFRIVAEIQPGPLPKVKIRRGECARIFTGAPIPAGASQVLMQETVRLEEDFVVPLERGNAAHIRRRGEDAHKGDLLLPAGSRLGAHELGLLASLGVSRPKVSRTVRVAHFATGNELAAPGRKLRPGLIYDSNGPLVAALIRQFGGEMVRQARVPDNLDLLLKKVRGLARSFDLLLLSGGAGAGDHDFGKQLLAASGFRIHFASINLRPGKPLVFATRGRQAAFVLPGNPVSHLVTLHAAVRLALDQFTGAPLRWPLIRVPLAEEFDYAPSGRELLCPARLEINNDGRGALAVRALPWQSSGDVTVLAGINALLRFGPNEPAPKAGGNVTVLTLEFP